MYLRTHCPGFRADLQGHRGSELCPGRPDDGGGLFRPGRHDAAGLFLLDRGAFGHRSNGHFWGAA